MAGNGVDPALAGAVAAGQPSDFTWIVVLGGITCFLTAFAIGANDVANTFSSSVGSRALPLWVAICLAAVLETIGATLLGGAVTDSIRSKIIDFEVFEGTPTILMSGMLCALIGAGGWLFLANKFGLPVSTTHAIIGALLGFGLASGNVHAVRWNQVASIVVSWLLAPVVASCVGGSLFVLLRATILRKPNSLQRAKRGLWFLLWLVTLTFSVFFVFKNYFELDCACKQLTPDNTLVLQRPCRISRWAEGNVGLAAAVAFGLSVVLTAIITWAVYRFAGARLAVYRYRHTAAGTKAEEAATADASAGGGRVEDAGGRSAGSGGLSTCPASRLLPATAAGEEADTRAAAACPASRGASAAGAAAGWTLGTGTAATSGGCVEAGCPSQPWGSFDGSISTRPQEQQQQHGETEAMCMQSHFLPSSCAAAAALFSPGASPLHHRGDADTSAQVAADAAYAASAAAASASDSFSPLARVSCAAASAADTEASAEDANKLRVPAGRRGLPGSAKPASSARDRPLASCVHTAAADSCPGKTAGKAPAACSVEANGAATCRTIRNSRRLGAPYSFLAGRRRCNSSRTTTTATASSLLRRASGRVGEASGARRGKLSRSSLDACTADGASAQAVEQDPSTAAVSNESQLRHSVPSCGGSRFLSSHPSSSASDVVTLRTAAGGCREEQNAAAAEFRSSRAAATGSEPSSLRATPATRGAGTAAPAAVVRATAESPASTAARGRGPAWWCEGGDTQAAGDMEACITQDQEHQCVQHQQHEDAHGKEEEQGKEDRKEEDRLGAESACVVLVVEQQHGQAHASERRGEESGQEDEALPEVAAARSSGEQESVDGVENTNSKRSREGNSSVQKSDQAKSKQAATEGHQDDGSRSSLAAAAAATLRAAHPAGGTPEAATSGTGDRQAATTAVPPAEDAAAVTVTGVAEAFKTLPATTGASSSAAGGAAAVAAAGASPGGQEGGGTAAFGVGSSVDAAAPGMCLHSEPQMLKRACAANGGSDEDEDESSSTPRDTPLSVWQKRLHMRWRTMPWFKDIHTEGQTEDELVARLQSGAEVFETDTEIFFSACQVVSACMGCIAHSANDTANAIGPFAAVLTIYQTGAAASQVESPWYVLLFGGLSMSLGLALLGYKVIKTVGVKLVKITPARGFAMDLGAAWTVLVFSALGIPLSTTHCAVGSTVGVGLMEPRQRQKKLGEEEPQHLLLLQQQKQEQRERGKQRPVKTLLHKMQLPSCDCLNISSVNWKLFGGVFVSWIVTILLSGLVSAGLFSFAAYSPRLLR